ncbi:MAG: DNA-3-methyladenine glycosylase [Neomegalonema sp.]|nr:DNA-3-methyladenine glycosylase [Neomegalonema sp.]
MRRIETEADLAEGAAHLCAVEPRFARVIETCGPPPLRRRPAGFAALLRVLVEQQVSVAAGNAIWARVEAAGCLTPQAVLARDIEGLRSVGLSRPKARYAQEIARAQISGGLDLQRLPKLSDEAARAHLTAITGIGPWTAEIYLMFCEGRPDLCPSGDIALQEAMRDLLGLAERPKGAEFDIHAAAWAPWRAIAARLLWSHYRTLKGREGKAS